MPLRLAERHAIFVRLNFTTPAKTDVIPSCFLETASHS